MAAKLIILSAVLAYANAGFLGAPAAVATYSAAPAVSSSYFHQASAPVAYAAPVAKTIAAAPVAYAAPAPVAYAAHAPVAYAAQAPVAYAAHAPAVAYAAHGPSVGLTQESVTRSLGGASSVSQYSKAEDGAFSSVRKFDTRITNDALTAYASPLAYAAPVAKAIAPVAAYAAHAPVAAYAAHAPVATYAAHAPVVKAAVAYSPAAVVAHTTFQGYGVQYAY